MNRRENPATVFMARVIGESETGLPWGRMGAAGRSKWLAIASQVVIDMYASGFTIPQPADPDAVWAELDAAVLL